MPGCSTRATLHLVGATSWTEVATTLEYDSADPFAVRIRFGGRAARAEDDGVEWLVARELLLAGLTRPSGQGDIRVWPARTAVDVLFLELRAPSGHALFELSRSVLAAFVADTERLVPLGHEADVADVGPELVALLDRDRPESEGR